MAKGVKRLTEQGVRRMTPPQAGRVEVWDAVVPGLHVRLTAKGVRTYSVRYRIHGTDKRQRDRIGDADVMPLAEARDAARRVLDWAARGLDPRGEARREREATERAQRERMRHTFDAVADSFLEHHCARLKPRTRAGYAGDLRRYFRPVWGERPVDSITRRDVLDVLDDLKARAPTAANRAFACLRSLFRHAVERDLIEQAPTDGLRPPAKERSRDRVLDDAELRAVWRTAGRLAEEGDLYAALLRVMFAVGGQRREDVASARWEDLDLAAGVWTIPAPTKADGARSVPLSELAVRLLEAVPRQRGPFVFGRKGETPFSGWTRGKVRFDAAAGVTGWRLHDVRRTCATRLAAAGVAPHVIDRLQGRTGGALSGVSAVYIRFSYFDEQRDALRKLARVLVALDADNVLPLRVGGAA